MFGLLKSNPIHPGQFLHLIGEKTAPNFFWSDDVRCEIRNNRSIPVTISPWSRGKPDSTTAMRVAITKDISENGLCLFCPFALEIPEIVLGTYVQTIEIDEPLFFRASVTKIVPIAKGFWQIGLRAEELLNSNYRKQMELMIPKAIELLTPEAPVVQED